jgi:hypothetical protein
MACGLRVKGLVGWSPYDYDLEFSANERARLGEEAFTGARKDAGIHAHAQSIGAFLRAVRKRKWKAGAPAPYSGRAVARNIAVRYRPQSRPGVVARCRKHP